MANRTLELMLDKVQVNESGEKKQDGQHMVIASLIWPRPLIAERVNAKTFHFEKNSVELAPADWIARILFKERVAGQFGIEFGVTARVTDSQVTAFLKTLGATMAKMVGNEVEDVMPSALFGGLVNVPFQFLSKLISNIDEDSPKLIARGSIVLHSEETWKRGAGKKTDAKTKKFKVPLVAPEDVRAPHESPPPHARNRCRGREARHSFPLHSSVHGG